LWNIIYGEGKRPLKQQNAVQEKLAGVGKQKSNWELQELLGLTALIMDSWKGDNQYKKKPGIIRKKHLVLYGSTGKLF
jgi:hypothetical protein